MRRKVVGKQVSDAAKQYAEWIIQTRATYVTGMFILGSANFLLGSFIVDYGYIRSTVKRELPNCAFDLQLDAIQFAGDSGLRLLRKLKYLQGLIRTERNFDFEVIFFDHFSQAYAKV